MIGHDLITIGIPIAEKVIRTVAVYGGLAVLLRLGGKRDLAQLNSFDLVVMLLLSNVVQNAVIGNDNSLTGGLLGAAVLVLVNGAIVRAAERSSVLVAVFEGTPTVLVTDGKYDEAALRHEALRRADVDLAIRRQGATDVSEVQEAVLEPGGSIVVTLRPEAQPATRSDINELLSTIRGLESQVAALSGYALERITPVEDASPVDRRRSVRRRCSSTSRARWATSAYNGSRPSASLRSAVSGSGSSHARPWASPRRPTSVSIRARSQTT